MFPGMPSLLDTCPGFSLPAEVRAWVTTLQGRGAEVYLVGGLVRDALLGQVASDYDLATNLLPAQLAAAVAGAGQMDLELGAWHLELAEGELAITCLREDGPYGPRRRPLAPRFGVDLEADARRRDFSCNALYADPDSLQLIDPLGGLADLQGRRIAVIGPVAERLREDPLRLLRAVRFAARLDFELAPATAAALGSEADSLAALSHERVFAELTEMFTGPGRGRGLRLLLETGLSRVVLPEIDSMPGVEQPPEYHPEGDVFVHVCLVLDSTRPGDPVQAWAAVLHDTGKPATFERAADRIRFNGHDTLSAEIAERVLRRFRAPRELRETVVEICRDHIKIASLQQMKRAKRERWMRSPRFVAHLEFHRADCLGSHAKLDLYEQAKAQLAVLPPLPPPPLCTGADVMALGVPQGPMVGRLLAEHRARCEAGDVQDRDTALHLLSKVVEECFSGADRGDDRS